MVSLWPAKASSDPPSPQVVPLLLPVEALSAGFDLLGLALHHDGGFPFPLHPVQPPHLVDLPLEGLGEGAGQVEGEVLVGLLPALAAMGVSHMIPHPA